MKNFIAIMMTLTLFSACKEPAKIDKKPVDIQLIRNATLKLNYNGKMFLIDPSFSPKNGFMSFVVPNQNLNPTVDLPLSIAEITQDVDAVLVTHLHLDHFDDEAKNNLNPSLPLFAQFTDSAALSQSPFTNVSLVDEKAEYHGTSIIRTEGKHGPDHLLGDLGHVSGFVLQAENHPTIYIIGDCLWDAEIRSTIQQYNPDIIIANSGGAQFMGETILMDENSVIALAKFAPNAKIMAVHMEALDHCHTTRQILQDAADAENIDILIPQDGETMTLK